MSSAYRLAFVYSICFNKTSLIAASLQQQQNITCYQGEFHPQMGNCNEEHKDEIHFFLKDPVLDRTGVQRA